MGAKVNMSIDLMRYRDDKNEVLSTVESPTK